MKGNKIRVLHIGYGHKKDDIRIAQKECNSLAEEGYEVYYVTRDLDETREAPEKVNFISIKNQNNTILVNYFPNRMLTAEYCRIIEQLKPRVIHVHEYGISYLIRLIKRKYPGIKVIYDVHEDNAHINYENDVSKYGKLIAKLLVATRALKEHEACRYADMVITVTPHIKELLSKYCSGKIEIIYNYPILSERNIDGENRKPIACYAGGVTENRGITEMLEISQKLDGKV